MRFAISFLVAAIGFAAFGQGTKADYERADSLATRLQGKVFRSTVVPHWMADGKGFWYTVEVAAGKRETYLVDTGTGSKELAFDAARLDKALAPKLGVKNPFDASSVAVIGFDGPKLAISASGRQWLLDRKTYDVVERTGDAKLGPSESLPAFLPPRASGSGQDTTLILENRWSQPVDVYWMGTDGARQKYFTLAPGERREQHTFANHVWLFTSTDGRALAAYSATEGPCAAIYDGTPPGAAARTGRRGESGTNAKWRVAFHDQNFFLRPTAGGDEIRMSADGKEGDTYGGPTVWSPSGSDVAVVRTEAGQEHKIHFVQSSPPDQEQPKYQTLDYLKPGDKIPHPRVVIFEADSHREIPVQTDQTPNPWEFTDFHWSADGKELYFVYNQRGHQVLRLMAADAATGKTRIVVEETSPTFIDYQGKLWVSYLDKTGEALWASERSGYNHIYLVDMKSGQMKPVTQGPWMVRSVERVDADRRRLIIRVLGRDPKQDPYHVHFAWINFDGTGFTPLTEGDGTHRLVWSPDNLTYLDSYSRVDMAPVTELRRLEDGKRLALLETGDDTLLRKTGWSAPERFVAKGRDGSTDIYGIIIKPTDFDPRKKYPVIEDIYAGPHDFFVPKSYQAFRNQAKVAELGFIVVQIDGMGTDWRGKKFHDVCWKNLSDAGFPDRILWMKAAGKTRPWMDLSRVGIYGTSAGGQSACSAVERFGDFYKAAVADCGCHDNRMDKIWWNELWMGWPVDQSYETNSNVTAAKNLKGKLYLMVGEVDTNVDPASTMQVVNALIQAGKDFDFLVYPNSNHGVLSHPYAFRRLEDFFVWNLYGAEPRR